MQYKSSSYIPPNKQTYFNQGKQEKPFFEIINWKKLDLYYGFLIIPSTVITREYLKSYVINQQFFQFNNLFPESFRERVNIEYRCDESNLVHQTSETYSTPEGK